MIGCWAPVGGVYRAMDDPKKVWICLMGVAFTSLRLGSFKANSDSCGGYVGIEEPTATRSYLWRAIVCVHGHSHQIPSSFWCSLKSQFGKKFGHV